MNRSNWEPKKQTKICSDHFVGGWHSQERDHPDYKPSIFPTSHVRPNSERDLQRHERARKRVRRDAPAPVPSAEIDDDEDELAREDEDQMEVEVS